MRIEVIILFLGIAGLFSGSALLSQEVADPSVPGENQGSPQAAGKAPYRLDAFVNWDYRHRPKLKGWRNTAILIRQILAEWNKGAVGGETVENGGPSGLQGFLGKLDSPKTGGAAHLIYLSSHQSPAGEWEFPNRQKIPWENLLADLSLPPDPHRIIILDVCHAAAVPDKWQRQLAPQGYSLLASSPQELTFELILNRRQPVWFKKRYPQEIAWLEQHFGEKWLRTDSRVSFLGFIWLRVFLKTQEAPRSGADWDRFLRRCEAEAVAFRNESSRKLSSTLQMTAPSG